MTKMIQNTMFGWMGVAAVLAIGCNSADPGQPAPGTYRLAAAMQPAPVRALDLLFVIDNSESMAEEQDSLANRAREALFDVLRVTEGNLPDLHLAVVSTDIGAHDDIANCAGQGDGGAFLPVSDAAACGLPNGPFLIDEQGATGERESNYEGTLEQAFSCMVELGTGGCGFEQPLEAMRRALDGSNPANAGFLRDDAMLAVVIVSDEDDCSAFDKGVFSPEQRGLDEALGPLTSFRCFDFGVTCDQADNRDPGAKTGCQPDGDSPYMTGVQTYVDFLRGLKDDPTMVVVAGIFGDADEVSVEMRTGANGEPSAELAPACESAAGAAVPGVRLAAFLDGFPARSLFTSICQEDLREPLTRAAKNIAGAVTGSACLHGALADADLDVAGVQPTCRVLVEGGADTWTELSACDEQQDAPCFEVVSATAACSHTGTGLAVDLARAQSTVDGLRVQVECLAP